MGRWTRAAQVLADYEQGLVDSRDEINEGLRAMFARGAGQPAQMDRFSREMAAYRAEVAAAAGDFDLSGYTDGEIAAMFAL